MFRRSNGGCVVHAFVIKYRILMIKKKVKFVFLSKYVKTRLGNDDSLIQGLKSLPDIGHLTGTSVQSPVQNSLMADIVRY